MLQCCSSLHTAIPSNVRLTDQQITSESLDNFLCVSFIHMRKHASRRTNSAALVFAEQKTRCNLKSTAHLMTKVNLFLGSHHLMGHSRYFPLGLGIYEWMRCICVFISSGMLSLIVFYSRTESDWSVKQPCLQCINPSLMT